MSSLTSDVPGAELDAPGTFLKSAPTETIEDAWPIVVVSIGLALSAAWTILLAYCVVRIIEVAI